MQTTTTSYRREAERAAEHLGDCADAILGAWDYHDPWGSNISAMFTLNDALYLAGGECNDTYSPGIGPPIDEDYLGPKLVAALESGELTLEDVETAERILDANDDRLREAGLSY